MMSWVWCVLFSLGTIWTTLCYGGDVALSAMMEGAQQAATLCISLAGAYMFWMGMLGIAKEAGLMEKLSNYLKKPCEWLFPGSGKATAAITLNIAANMLGMGNAATPFGLDAMRLMQEGNKTKKRATDAMCTLLAVNASALQIIPSTMIGLRSAAGSASPSIIVIPTIASSAVAVVSTVVLCKILVKKA